MRDRIDATSLRQLLTASAGAEPERVERLTSELGAEWLERLAAAVSRYMAGAPLAYAAGEVRYCGRTFRSDARALALRTYNEPLVRRAVADFAGGRVRALDLGCGAGAWACVLALELTGEVVGADVAPDALELARENATRHGARVHLVRSDLFENVAGRFDVIISSLPWEEPEEILPEAAWEPHVALYDDSGQRYGMIQRLLREAPRRLTPSGRLYLEVPPDRQLLDRLPGEAVLTDDGQEFGRVMTRRQVEALADRLGTGPMIPRS